MSNNCAYLNRTAMRAWLAALLLVGIIPTTTRGQAAADVPAAPPKTPWETTAAAGLTLTRGNSETILGTLTLDSKRKSDKNEFSFGAAAGYGKDKDVKNTEFANAFGQYNRMATERLFYGLRLDGNYDGISKLDYRLTLSPLLGYYLVKRTNTTLVVEAGPSAVFEQYRNKSEETYLGARFGERLDQKISDSTKIWESLSYVPRVDKWAEKYILTGEAGIDTSITKHWSLRVVLQDIYDSQPNAGRKKNDLRLIAGTAFKF